MLELPLVSLLVYYLLPRTGCRDLGFAGTTSCLAVCVLPAAVNLSCCATWLPPTRICWNIPCSSKLSVPAAANWLPRPRCRRLGFAGTTSCLSKHRTAAVYWLPPPGCRDLWLPPTTICWDCLLSLETHYLLPRSGCRRLGFAGTTSCLSVCYLLPRTGCRDLAAAD